MGVPTVIMVSRLRILLLIAMYLVHRNVACNSKDKEIAAPFIEFTSTTPGNSENSFDLKWTTKSLSVEEFLLEVQFPTGEWKLWNVNPYQTCQKVYYGKQYVSNLELGTSYTARMRIRIGTRWSPHSETCQFATKTVGNLGVHNIGSDQEVLDNAVKDIDDEQDRPHFTINIINTNTILINDSQLLNDFTTILKNNQFSAYYFETPKVSKDKLTSTLFEFVLKKSFRLESAEAEPSRFEEHFGSCRPNNTVVSFSNLRGDSKLIVPCSSLDVSDSSYTSLAHFMRSGQTNQIEQFWKKSAQAMLDQVRLRGHSPTWMSTAGLGVYWLHLRLDPRPKYYKFRPYTY